MTVVAMVVLMLVHMTVVTVVVLVLIRVTILAVVEIVLLRRVLRGLSGHGSRRKQEERQSGGCKA